MQLACASQIVLRDVHTEKADAGFSDQENDFFIPPRAGEGSDTRNRFSDQRETSLGVDEPDLLGQFNEEALSEGMRVEDGIGIDFQVCHRLERLVLLSSQVPIPLHRQVNHTERVIPGHKQALTRVAKNLGRIINETQVLSTRNGSRPALLTEG